MAHGLLNKLTYINTKQQVFFLFQSNLCTYHEAVIAIKSARIVQYLASDAAR